MIVMLLEQLPPSVRGELSRWLLEPTPGLFIGRLSALVRDQLWQKCVAECTQGGIFQAWSTNNEQGFTMRTHGDTSRRIVDFEGLLLIQIPHPPPEKQSKALKKKLQRLDHLIRTSQPPPPPPPPSADDLPF